MSMEAIKELRVRTHLGLTECKKALEASQGDVEQAIEWLMKQGLKHADKAVETLEGQVRACIYKWHEDILGRIYEVNCQTDFAAKSDLFNAIIEYDRFDVESINLLSKQLGEVVRLRRSESYVAQNNYTRMYSYNHPNGKIAVLLVLEISQDIQEPKIDEMAEHLMLQIAATSPKYLKQTEIPIEVLEKQKKLFEEQLASEKKPKPQDKWPKIIEGKMKKWMEECVLLEQISVIDNKTKILTLLEQQLVPRVLVKKFYRYELGEVV